MATPVYLIRHAQSHLSAALENHEWPLSRRGATQAERLVPLLKQLGITKLFSSPYRRCLSTVDSFATSAGVDIIVDPELRERTITHELRDDFEEIWRRSWDDFSFALPGCETSLDAQDRFVKAVRRIARDATGIVGISTHGNVIGLLMRHLDSRWGREQTDRLRNPDVLKLTLEGDDLIRDLKFRLPGLDAVASGSQETPIDW